MSAADLIVQYFLLEILGGASLGRAALRARQRYVREIVDLDPTDLKTLAQFTLLGDPAVHPVRSDAPPIVDKAADGEAGDRQRRRERRAKLAVRRRASSGIARDRVDGRQAARARARACTARSRQIAKDAGIAVDASASGCSRFAHRSRRPTSGRKAPRARSLAGEDREDQHRGAALLRRDREAVQRAGRPACGRGRRQGSRRPHRRRAQVRATLARWARPTIARSGWQASPARSRARPSAAAARAGTSPSGSTPARRGTCCAARAVRQWATRRSTATWATKSAATACCSSTRCVAERIDIIE